MNKIYLFLSFAFLFLIFYGCKEDNPGVPPSVTTVAVTDITATTAKSGGNVTADGGADVTARGICYGTTANPTTTDSKVEGGTGTGAFTSALVSLTANTKYYVRAYATNSEGTTYGKEVEFTTKAVTLPVVTTATTVTDITDPS